MIPTKTGAAAAVGLVLPELSGKLDGFVASTDGQCFGGGFIDPGWKKHVLQKLMTFWLKRWKKRRGVIGANLKQTVSVDFNHDARSSI